MHRRIALFGGTFDPVHIGHTAVAEHAAAHLQAEEVFFIPARRSPHKFDAPLVPVEHRLNMLSLALADHPSFSVSTCEVERSEPSYTFDTVMEFREKLPGASLFWLVGADTVESLPRWYRIGELLDACNVCVMVRGGVESPQLDTLVPSLGPTAVSRLKQSVIPTPLIPISSSEVRARLAAGQDVSDMLHPAVLTYINDHSLYRPKAPKVG